MHLHGDAGGHVHDAHRALCLVDVLPAGARSAVHVDAQVLWRHGCVHLSRVGHLGVVGRRWVRRDGGK